MPVSNPNESAGGRSLHGLRRDIDTIDDQIILLLGQRFAVTREVGELKALLKLGAIDADREFRQRQRYRALAAENELDPDLVESLFRVLVTAVVAEHRDAQAEHVASATPAANLPGG